MIDRATLYTNNFNILSNQTLNVYDSFGFLIKTINIKNSVYTREHDSLLAIGVNFLVLPQQSTKPLKFDIAH